MGSDRVHHRIILDYRPQTVSLPWASDQAKRFSMEDSTASSSLPGPATGGDMGDHLAEARLRARQMLGGEAHAGNIDDWRLIVVAARDGTVLASLLWLVLHGVGVSAPIAPVMAIVGIGYALFVGITSAWSTLRQVKHYEAELERERREIRETPEHEREEVHTLYAAKGFEGPLLEQVVDTLCADDDRLLKVMMEEELGLRIHHIGHPIVVGLIHGGGALLGAVTLAATARLVPATAATAWLLVVAGAIIGILAAINARFTRQPIVPAVATWLVMASTAGGVAYFLAEWRSSRN